MRIVPAYLSSVCLILSFFAGISTAKAQCANGQTAKYLTYDTVVLGSGNDNYNFTFRQFDPSLGTSVSVRLDTYVSLEYTFQLENNNVLGSLHTVRVSRTDELTYPTGAITKTDRRNLGPYLLGGTNGILGVGPDFIQDGPLPVFQGLHNIYTIVNDVVPFLGNGTVAVNYATESFANVVGNLNSTLRGAATDTVLFKLSYFYCPTASLPSDLSNFTARREASGSVRIKWFSPTDYVGKKFEVEKSLDGRSFQPIQELRATSNVGSNYEYVYKPTGNDKTKVFFRIKEYDEDGSFSYSAVRDVSLPYTESNMKVYPTMATGSVQVFFPLANRADYKVSIVSMTGQVMQQAEYLRTNLFKVNFNQALPSGTYIVHVINKQTLEAQQSKIVVK